MSELEVGDLYMACAKEVKNTKERRRLNAQSSPEVLPIYRQIAVGSVDVTGLEKRASGFVCRSCFNSLKWLNKLEHDVEKIKKDIMNGMKQLETSLGLGNKAVSVDERPSVSRPQNEETAGDTPTRRRHKRPLDSPDRPYPKRTVVNTPTRKCLNETVVTGNSPAVSVVVKSKQNRGRVHQLTSSLKKLGRSVGRRNRKSIARQALCDKSIRQHTIRHLCRDIQRELKLMCRTKKPSILRSSAPETLCTFKWDALIDELRSTAPTFLQLLEGATTVSISPSKRRKKSRRACQKAIVGACACIVLRYRNHSMNLLQRLVSMLLYSGHAIKRSYRRLQKLLLCLSHHRTVKYLDKLGYGYDDAVHVWRRDLEQRMRGETQATKDSHSCVTSQTCDDQCTPSYRPSSSDSQSTNSVGLSCSSLSSSEAPSSSSSSPSSDSESETAVGMRANVPRPLSTNKLVGDNLDKNVVARDMRIDYQGRSLHFFQMYAVKDRVDLTGVSDGEMKHPNLSTISFKTILPTSTDAEFMTTNFSQLIARVLVKRIPFFKKFGIGVDRHIVHDKYEEMSRKSEVVPLGVILKNENNHEDMVEIMDHAHQYVPTQTSDVLYIDESGESVIIHKDRFHHTLFGGDQLTCVRARGAQRICCNSTRGREQLKGLTPVIEDWHAKMCLLSVIWKRLYSCASARNGGTLYQLKNLINRKNVPKKPKNGVAECEEFFTLVTEAHILSSAMSLFGMNFLEDEPAVSSLFPHGCSTLDPKERSKVLLLATRAIVDKFVDLEFSDTKDSGRLPPKKEDYVQSYAREVLTLGLLLMEFCDAIREGDGLRILRVWRYLFLLFKATGRKNYSIEAFTLLCQYHFFFTPRMAQQLLWSRCVNVHGRPGKNIPMDLHMEHLNRECKTAIAGVGANITDSAVKRVGKCIGELVKITANFDGENGVPAESGYHSARFDKTDLDKMVKQLSTDSVFSFKPKRAHSSYKRRFQRNAMRRIDHKQLQQWMCQKYQNLVMYN